MNSIFFTDIYNNFKVHLIPCRQDNYSFVIETPNKSAVLIDSSESKNVLNFLKQQNLNVAAILATHHHYDHVDGFIQIQNLYNCPIYCSQFEAKQERIPGNLTPVKELQSLKIENLEFIAHFSPGHTLGHICYHVPKSEVLFVGDLLFSLGCGRVFEETPDIYKIFYSSLQKIKRACTSETLIYCAHEYTLANLEFCQKNKLTSTDLSTLINTRFSSFKPSTRSIPTSMSFEATHNPFLTAKNHKDFKELRLLKDKF